MRVPKHLIEEAKKRGIVPGATIRDKWGDEGIVAPFSKWKYAPKHNNNWSIDNGGIQAIYIRSAAYRKWAKVIKPAPKDKPSRKATKSKTMSKSIVVTIKKTKHAKQPYLVTIDRPGKGPNARIIERYSQSGTAKRGALRMLKAYRGRFGTGEVWLAMVGKKEYPVQFVKETSRK